MRDRGRRHGAFALDVYPRGLWHVFGNLDAYFLQVQHDVGHVLANARDRRELVQDTLDAHRADRRPLQRGEQDSTQRVADGDAESTLEWLGYELAVVGGEALLFDLQSLRLDQILPISLKHET